MNDVSLSPPPSGRIDVSAAFCTPGSAGFLENLVVEHPPLSGVS